MCNRHTEFKFRSCLLGSLLYLSSMCCHPSERNDHGSPYLPSFVALSNIYIFINPSTSCSLIHLYKNVSYFARWFPLSLSNSIYAMSAKFFKLSFLLIYSRYFNCLFPFFIKAIFPVPLKIPLHTFSVSFCRAIAVSPLGKLCIIHCHIGGSTLDIISDSSMLTLLASLSGKQSRRKKTIVSKSWRKQWETTPLTFRWAMID